MISKCITYLYAIYVHYEHRSGQSKKECSYPVPSIFDIIICGFTPSVRMFIGQGLSLEARRAAQAERWSANTATVPASVAAATAAASTTAAAAANEWASSAAAASTTAAAKSGLRQFKALKSIRPVRTGPIKFILFVNIPRLFSVYSGINRKNKLYTNNGSHPVVNNINWQLSENQGNSHMFFQPTCSECTIQ